MERKHTDTPDDLSVIEAMEAELCRKHHISRKLLYPVLRQADFHRTWNDPAEHWNAAAYAAFSGEVLTRTLDCEQLKSLLADFDSGRESHKRAWASVMADELMGKELRRLDRDHCAIAHRYACATADDYVFPVSYLLGHFTMGQYLQFNSYLEYVSEYALNPASKQARQACQRQLDDLARSQRENKGVESGT